MIQTCTLGVSEVEDIPELERDGEIHCKKLVHTPTMGWERFNSSMLVTVTGSMVMNINSGGAVGISQLV